MSETSWVASGLVGALSVPAGPGPFTIHAQVMAAPAECPACGDEYLADCTTWLGQVCYPPATDYPIGGGHAFEIPAWCATQRRFLDEDGAS